MVRLAVKPVALEFKSEHGWTLKQDWTQHLGATEVGLKTGDAVQRRFTAALSRTVIVGMRGHDKRSGKRSERVSGISSRGKWSAEP